MEFSRMEKRQRTKRLFVVLYLYVIGELFIMRSIKIDYSCCARNKRSLLSFPRRKIGKLLLQRGKLTDPLTEILSNRYIKKR